jgi:hypothetical protein
MLVPLVASPALQKNQKEDVLGNYIFILVTSHTFTLIGLILQSTGRGEFSSIYSTNAKCLL